MGPPEGVRRGWVRDSKLVKDESVEIRENTVEKSTRARGIDTFTSYIITESKLEGV
jgi:hypothetical protein